jgi:hypothetical protein
MTNNLITTPSNGASFQQVPPVNQIIEGNILRCVDGRWTCNEVEVPTGTAMLAIGVVVILLRRQGGKPVEKIVASPDQSLEELKARRDQLNAAIPQDQWEIGKFDNAPSAPWELHFGCYLVGLEDGAAYTFLNKSHGAERAVRDLKSRVERMRLLRGELVLPIVELSSATMKTRYGSKQRPEFAIKSWRSADGFAGATAAPQIEAPAADLEPWTEWPPEPVTVPTDLQVRKVAR